jgi:hypothetical protein
VRWYSTAWLLRALLGVVVCAALATQAHVHLFAEPGAARREARTALALANAIAKRLRALLM